MKPGEKVFMSSSRKPVSKDAPEEESKLEIHDCSIASAFATYKAANAFYKESKYRAAISAYYSAAQNFKSISAPRDIFLCYQRIACCYMHLADANSDTTSKKKQLQMAKEWFKFAIKYFVTFDHDNCMHVKNNHEHLQFCHLRLLDLYRQENKLDKAIYHATEALKSASIAYSHNPKEIAVSLYTLASVYSKKKDYTNSLLHLEGALEIYDQLEDSDAQKPIEQHIINIKTYLANQQQLQGVSLAASKPFIASTVQPQNEVTKDEDSDYILVDSSRYPKETETASDTNNSRRLSKS